jgi:cytosine/uracil/thiamine/allantoin permease
LESAGVKTIADLAKRSPKYLAKKTGLPITQISSWIIEANKLQNTPSKILA